jgi:ribulose-phosphate 3-epimerase
MTVEPGFGGQSFMTETLPKLRAAREVVDREGLAVWLQVDGGITEATIVQAAEAGADTFVAGSSVYGGGDPETAIAGLRRAGSGFR